ncbi:MAG: ATP-binding cassette domain-containing protein [Inconstantimicrobium porci]|uniref:ATP-binding cassette domain-containing protein n=1 Tax=Inconstantimicrobium porci TaxID=2652291 RepID=A0A7X2T0U6_9CLOT|nr:ATP-binding cassette domain-containing protein [Inconstantimicrobium porci]MDD6771131.1 ATP-binding cassette domain-containing protein [Inconstantimicrobium porci]MDY5911354.1 ATP-binding cassette domain-containing protein [Inconstantimicrobium porci]MSR90991.1 ATP-binding cassette domain-containing protein [Inconstantimicrobium porci]
MLELKNISFYSEDNKKILDNICLEIDNNFTVITGPNGSGKSTLAKIIAGIKKPTSGKIIFNGEDITNLSITERAKRGMSYAFQQPVRFKGLKVKDLMSLAAGKESSLSEVCDLLSEVGLCARDYINRNIDGTLSGGELKRIEIAMVIARNTQLSIFDEPEAGIDLWSFQKLIHVFEKLYKSNDKSILIISHQERILNIADKIIYLKDGVVEKYDERENILNELLKSTENAQCKVLKDKMEAK